jgi:hypothetical protein
MTSPLRMKRPITRRAPITWTRTVASLLACCLFLGGSQSQAQEPPTPELPPHAGTPMPVSPVDTAASTRAQTIDQAVYFGKSAGQDAIQQTAQTPAKAKERADDSYDFSVATELPGPDRVFRRQSESEFLERIRQESRVKPGQGRIIFPEEQPLTTETYERRHFPHIVKGVEPAYVCHGRLFFEQPNFERQGWDLGYLTPLVNLGVYYYDLALLPYHCATCPFQRTDCSAGKCLPGDPTPFYLYPEKLSVTGLVGQATVVTGLFYLFP